MTQTHQSAATQSTKAPKGRVTLPIEEGIDDQLPIVLKRLGADAVRNSDGTSLPESVADLGAKIYATYFVGRGDQEWALAHPDQGTQVYLMSTRTPAPESGPLRIEIMKDWFADQVEPDITCDTARWWQVIDRTSGRALDSSEWTVSGSGKGTIVEVTNPEPFHVYTVGFLAWQRWDPTQMYNYLMNGWENEPGRVKERPFDARHDETWEHIKQNLKKWCADHPEVDVVRFTTFFYHFTLVYGADAKERFVDWFGYSASVSVPAMEEFEKETGIKLTAEDFVDGGYYNSTFRVPSPAFRAWIEFQNKWVDERVAELVKIVHDAGKEAIMFLGDNWIGTEPYGKYFAKTGIDAVVGSSGSAATTRMISDIPGVKYTEVRFLPYFFPDVFNPEGDPLGEANESWLTSRRAIVRSPVDRIGYGGYLSLALQFPEFVDRIEEIADEFREIHDRSGGEKPANAPITVAFLNAWGSLRSWQTHMVAHSMPYRETYSYLGALEAIAGLPFDVRFLSFDDIRDGVPSGIDVLINVGSAGTAFSGGDAWLDPKVQASVRKFVAKGGGFIGIGDPSAVPANGAVFQLSDVLGVEKELGWSLSSTRQAPTGSEHFIAADLADQLNVGEDTQGVFPISDATEVVRVSDGQVKLAASQFGAGRAVYIAGLPYSAENSRLLHRAIYWAANREGDLSALGLAADPRVEVAWYPNVQRALITNTSNDRVATSVATPLGEVQVDLPAGGYRWIEAA